MIRIYGNTYPHVRFLRSLRAQFDPSDKSWSIPSASVEDLKRLWSLSGVTVIGCNITPVVEDL